VNASGSPTEECDDGNNVSGDGCSSTCDDEPICGDGVKEGNEQCDDGCGGDACTDADNGDGCSKSCKIEHRCGDGVKDAGEECDDGDGINGTGNSNCTVNCLLAIPK
jgi:cysteine-rich repeat protein